MPLKPWVTWSASLTVVPFILIYLCTSVGPWGTTHCSACPVLRHSESGPLGLSVRECGAAGCASGLPHSASLGPAMATGVLSAPVPVSAPPTSLDVCFFFIYLVSDFLAIRFSVSSCCARRRSVPTYATILVLPFLYCFNWIFISLLQNPLTKREPSF